MLEKLPRHRFELFAYSTSQVCDHLTRRIQARVQQWLAIKHMDDQALAQRIREDRIDILIDLCGHNAGNRMGAMALQPAPLQESIGKERRPLSWVVGDQGVYRAEMPSQKEERREQRIAVTNLRSPDEV